MSELLRPVCSNCGRLSPIAVVDKMEWALRRYLADDFGWLPTTTAGGEPWLCHQCDAHPEEVTDV